MGRKYTITSAEKPTREIRPAITPEARENQLISLAVDLAEKQLLEGTASSQVITHFLKLGSSRERLEQEKLKKDQELIDAKKDSLNSTKTMEELYSNAIKAMRTYAGHDEEIGEVVDDIPNNDF